MSDQEKISDLLTKLKEKDEDNYEHSLRVQRIVDKILTQFDMDDAQKAIISTAAVLHDIGNIKISDDLLKKSGRLDMDEYEEVKQHVEYGPQLLKDLDCYSGIKDLIRHHHENINGFGYPDGLEGDEIPLGARIIHVAEAYDSMTAKRSFKKTVFTTEMALKDLKDYAGRMYDPKVIEKFLVIQPDLESAEDSQ